jgi:hypothetical protein
MLYIEQVSPYSERSSVHLFLLIPDAGFFYPHDAGFGLLHDAGFGLPHDAGFVYCMMPVSWFTCQMAISYFATGLTFVVKILPQRTSLLQLTIISIFMSCSKLEINQ